MPQPAKGPRLGGSAAHQKHMLANLAKSLFEHGSITTTEKRAKVLRPYAERLITKAKKGTTAARRDILKDITDRSAVAVLIEELAPKFGEREGGYTRIVKVGNRKGDNAPMAKISLVLEPVSKKQAVVKEAEKATEKAAEKDEVKEEEVKAEEVTEEETSEATEEAKADEADEAKSEESAEEAGETDKAEEKADDEK